MNLLLAERLQEHELDTALYALNGVLIRVRAMAYDQIPRRELAEVLDVAEYLPRLIAAEQDKTDEFRQHLADLAHRHPDFGFVIERFDQQVPKNW